ncbi:uncharacterized protein PITG_16439 [Phytophthora infestans T30-4]|uniref:Uncharacterized protein n=1 Tax=Phytophthora infestans (strain T30-4) TaxID=403677 RepID=D0NTM7_PHYIT|nr:uncharacterized protein PITG_16439 [Phytophthora infestans T30-4]EEY64989.1 conserved hypothetical protein [Phytophthora infestans T30-4]|eukprot:XP_002897477.1 conserved hypothetical protein [Phytophthora infestans T30-4]
MPIRMHASLLVSEGHRVDKVRSVSFRELPSESHVEEGMEPIMPSDEERDTQCAPEFQLIRRKRPRTPDSNAESHALPARGSPDKAPRLMVLPGLAELLAAQKQRNEGVAADALLDVLSRVSSEQEQTYVQTQEEEVVVEDKTPWPSASQYFDIFSTPKSELKIPIYDLGLDPRGVPLHPEFIYSQPVSCMYFLKCSRLLGKGSFGFPRKKKTTGDATSTTTTSGKKPAGKGGKKESSKDFEWRKMSFVTGLPKKQPIVRYITATCYSRATDVSAKKKVFRMHAVMLADEVGTGEKGDYVLVHIRAGGSKRVGLRASLADAEAQQAPASPTATAKQNADLLCMRRPVSPTSVAVSSYSSSTASTSPRNKKLLHADFVSNQDDHSDHLARVLGGSTGSPSAVPSVARHPLFTAAEDPNVDSARLALRNMILKSCTSRDEMAKYVMGLQEELAALQNQNQ